MENKCDICICGTQKCTGAYNNPSLLQNKGWLFPNNLGLLSDKPGLSAHGVRPPVRMCVRFAAMRPLIPRDIIKIGKWYFFINTHFLISL